MKKTLFFLLCFSFILTVNSDAQTTTLDYKISVAFFDIGTYSVTQEIKEDSVFYSAVSNVWVSYLFSKYRVKFASNSSFYKDTLMSCHVDVFVNDKFRESNHTEYIEKKYKILRTDKDNNIKDEVLNIPAIFVTSTMLFFNQPDETEYYAQNYAELYAYFNKIVRNDKHTFDIIDKLNGRKTRYTYKKGKIISTEVDYPLMTFGLKRVKK